MAEFDAWMRRNDLRLTTAGGAPRGVSRSGALRWTLPLGLVKHVIIQYHEVVKVSFSTYSL
jgi:hypothetical protein